MKFLRVFSLIQFWGWNILGVFVLSYLMGLLVLPFALAAFLTGELPLTIFVCILLLVALPFAGLYVGFKKNHVAIPFFFGVQLPVFFLAIFRITIMRELNFGGGLLVVTALVGGLIFTWGLWRQVPSSDDTTIATAIKPTIFSSRPILRAFALTPVVIAGVFTAVLGSLYILPLAAEVLKGFFSFNWVGDSWEVLPFLPFMLLFFVTAVAVCCFPIYLGYYYPKYWWRGRQSSGDGMIAETLKPASKPFLLTSLGLIFLWVIIHSLSARQSDHTLIADLNQMNSAELQQAMTQPDKVRKALLNGYLHEYRYLGVGGFQNNLKRSYDRSIGGESLGNIAQSIQSYLLGPVIYGGKTTDKRDANQLYSRLFDTPIQRAEKKAITKSITASFNRDEVTAGLMNAGIRNVEIIDQTIRSQDFGEYAQIEIEESYRNLTFDLQETFYYFSLPEDAAITGIWIGQTRNREEMDAYIVAPRGAAQQVYEQQVRQRIDPALLEQVGPGQYRLRVFPIPVTKLRADFFFSRMRREERAEYMNVHIRYVVPRSEQGFALPVLSEKRNVDWTPRTKRTLNGKPVKSKNWIPVSYVQASADRSAEAISTQIKGESVAMKTMVGTKLPPIGRYLVVADTSYSMRGHDSELRESLTQINSWREAGREIDIVLARDGKAAERIVAGASMSDTEFSYFGSLSHPELISQLPPETQDYDAVILLTDKGRYANSRESDVADLVIAAPLWIMHLGPAPSALDDNVLDLIYQSGGGVTGSLPDLTSSLSLNSPTSRFVEGRLWTLADAGSAEPLAQDAMTSLAARQVILQGAFGQSPDNETLDRFHDIAKSYDVVSPYSSMIVLVNERQKEALKKASEADDRFDREGRSGEENLTSPNSPLVSGVPEPHEWLLIIVCILGLFWLYRRRDNLHDGFA